VRRRVEAGRERERNALLQKLQEEEELLRKRMADEVCNWTRHFILLKLLKDSKFDSSQSA
jgi:hypothetical protein